MNTAPTDERWLPVVGYEGIYSVSSHGRVRRDGSHRYVKAGRILKGRARKNSDHLVVGLHRDGKSKDVGIHRLVLLAFVGPCPEGMQACHFPDRDPANNRLSNLRWDTVSGNRQDAIIHGTFARGELHGNAKLTAEKVAEIKSLVVSGVEQNLIASKFGISPSTICDIKAGRSWRHVA